MSEERFLHAVKVELLRHAQLRPEHAQHLLFQTSTVDALLGGHFDGDVTIGELLEHGDLGLGTLDGLDGELVVIDGQALQARVDLALHPVPPERTTPYAVVVDFSPTATFELDDVPDLDALGRELDEHTTPGRPAAVRVDGRLSQVRVRSVPKQSPPYPTLADVVAQQHVEDLADAEGSLVGFRFPDPMGGVEMKGWHLHFVTADRRMGGHVLEAAIGSGVAQVDPATELHVELPRGVDAPAHAVDEDAVRRLERGG